jgi:hypothetical protein
MALGDNVFFAHFWDSLDSDSPVKTPTDAGGGDPSVAGSKATFASADSGDGQTFSSVGTFNPGTDGDWAVAIRFKITTDTYYGNALLHLGTSGNWLQHLVIGQSGSDGIHAYYSYDGAVNHKISTSGSAINFTTTYTLVVNFDSSLTGNYCTLYLDGVDATSTRTGDFRAPASSESLAFTSSSDVTIGSEYDGSRSLDGEIEWAVVWTRALTTDEITTNMNETDLKAAILSGASVVPLAAYHYTKNTGSGL